jgi:hypothetical protein
MNADDDRKPGLHAVARSEHGSSEQDSAELGRRQLLKVLGATGAIVSAQMLLPRSWTSPVVDVGVLPAHATTSNPGTCTGSQTARATANADGTVTLTWSNFAESVEIWRKTSTEQDHRIGKVDQPITTFTDFTAQKGNYYTYTVKGSCTKIVEVQT